MTVGLAMATTNTAWAGSELRVTDFGQNKEVVILIKDPNDLTYLRQRLAEIEAYWRAQVNAL